MEVANFKNQLIVNFSIILGSILAAAVALYFLSGGIGVTVQKIAQNETLINQQANALGLIATLKQQASQATTYQTAMNQLLPNQDGLIGFSQWISGIANQYQVTANVAFQGSAEPAVLPSGSAAGLGQMGFSLSANGTADNLVAFLNDVESKASGFLVTFISFDVTNSSNNYNLAAQGDVFFRQ